MDIGRLKIVSLFGLMLTCLPAFAAPLTALGDPDRVPGTIAAKGSSIAEAWLIAPTRRYDHLVRGNASEAGGVRLRLRSGEVLTLLLDTSHVFEDAGPRLADFDGDGDDEVALVLTALDKGASLAILKVADGTIGVLTQTPYIGQPHRWLNPAGIADFNGDDRLDIALIQMPHLEKRLELWSLQAGGLQRWAQVSDVANHRLGSNHTGMAAVADFDGDGLADLAIPDGGRSVLRFIGFAGSTPRVLFEAPLPSPADGDFQLVTGPQGPAVRVMLENGSELSIEYAGPRNG